MAYHYEYKYLGYEEGRRKIDKSLCENFLFDNGIEFSEVVDVFEEYCTNVDNPDARIIRINYRLGKMGVVSLTFMYGEFMDYIKKEGESCN